MPTLAHKIRLHPTPDQIQYFKQAAGTTRMVWNWALDAWNQQEVAGQHPNAYALKKQFNTIKYQQFPWLHTMHRDAHSQPFADLGEAWRRFLTGQNDRPVFKKKAKRPRVSISPMTSLRSGRTPCGSPKSVGFVSPNPYGSPARSWVPGSPAAPTRGLSRFRSRSPNRTIIVPVRRTARKGPMSA